MRLDLYLMITRPGRTARQLTVKNSSSWCTKSVSGAPDILEAPEKIGGPWRTRTSDPLIKSRAEEPRIDTHDEVSREDSDPSS